MLGNIPAVETGKGNALFSNLATLLAYGFSLAGRQSCQEILEVPVTVVVPVELASNAV